MKRFLALAALVLGLAACQTEPEGLNVNVGGEVDTVVSVSLPEATRAGVDSAVGFDLATLENSDYSLRYILEIYLGEKCQRHVLVSDATSVAFPVRLAPGRDYTFVAWADIVEERANGEVKTELELKADRYYNTTSDRGLRNISIIEDKWNAMDETRDAFTAKEIKTGFSAQAVDLHLKRPFAKLRVVATDYDDVEKLGLAPASAVVTYSQVMPRTYNALEQEVTGVEETNRTHNITYDVENHVYDDATGEFTLFADYFFADANYAVAKFSLDVYAANDTTPIKHTDFNTDIHVAANKLTTIKGDVLTTGANIKIDIENRLDEEKVYEIVEVYNATELQEAINEADDDTVIVLANDIVLGATASTLSTRSAENNSITVAEGTIATIDLNGKTIRTVEQSEGRHYYAIYNYGNLTIKDSGENGAIVSRGIYNYGTLTLESGKIDACDGNGGYAVYNQSGSRFVMNGGSVVTSNEDGDDRVSGNYDASPLRVDANATATIKGGNITNVSNYTFAIDNYGTTTIEGGTFTSVHSTIANAGTMTIKGDATTIKCEGEYTSAHPIYANGEASNTYVNGGNFIGNNKASCYYVAAEENTNVYISGGIFTNAGQAAFTGKGNIVVTGGKFDKDPSARVVKGYVAEKKGDVFEVSKIALEENFADNSWDKIILACQNDIVPETWAVGNMKAMTIGDKDYQIRILGKNHDTYTAGGKAPLTFQIAEVYGAAPMNATQTNTTGWSGSKMRTVTMAEILEVMPVKDAIKAVNKETLNGTRDGLETTSDKLFLLSEIEVNGSVFFSNNFAEGSRYAYYANGGSQIMSATWWLRGPGKSNDIGYTQINMSGYMANGSAEYACGVVFGFCF